MSEIPFDFWLFIRKYKLFAFFKDFPIEIHFQWKTSIIRFEACVKLKHPFFNNLWTKNSSTGWTKKWPEFLSTIPTFIMFGKKILVQFCVFWPSLKPILYQSTTEIEKHTTFSRLQILPRFRISHHYSLNVYLRDPRHKKLKTDFLRIFGRELSISFNMLKNSTYFELLSWSGGVFTK